MGSMRGLEELGALGDPSASSSSSDNTYFDASKYAFFGKGAMEEVELGGLEDENENNDSSRFGGPNDAEYRFPSLGDKDEVDVLSSLAHIDDLSSTFAKLNRTVSGSRNAGVIGDRRSVSMESSSTTDWTPETEFTSWVDPQLLDPDLQDNKRWWSQPEPPTRLSGPESKFLHRTSSYPLQPLPHHHSNAEPIPIPKSHSTSAYPYPYQNVQNTLTRHSSIPSPSSRPHFPPSGSSSSHLSLTGFPHGLPYGSNIYSSSPPLYHLNDPMSSMLFSQQQILNQFQMPMYSPHLASIIPDLNLNQRPRPSPRGNKHHHHHHARFSNNSLQNSQNTLVKSEIIPKSQFRSKYMSSEEIESILKMQHSGTHNNDPYSDDYYHQACIAIRASGSYNARQRFCPTTIKDLPSSKSRNSNSDSHGHLQVDSLGRVSFSSIRRPKALLEPELIENKSINKPLEKEIPLAARITIEDGFALLLEIDDIDRVLQFNPPQDGGFQLKRRRQVLLEGLAASLELVDPLSPSKPGNSVGLSSKDDLIFLRLVSLPKGWKLVSRYLQVLLPGSELARLVCMAICRHLRFLFGGFPTDASSADTITKLSKSVSQTIKHMELSSLSACLAAVVCSTEQPPLRPVGSPAGDGASIIIKSILERATELFTNPRTSSICTMQNRAFWQASFDAFFKLLTKYCVGKYESIVQMLIMNNNQVGGADVARAISREMPAELLCASLPHTNEQQKDMLIQFAQRASPVTGFRSDGPGSGSSESVPG